MNRLSEVIQHGFKEPDNGIAVVRRFDLQRIYQSIGFAGGKRQERQHREYKPTHHG
jgi:hypothetical protein